MRRGVGLHIIGGDEYLECYGCKMSGCAPLDGWKAECVQFSTYADLYRHMIDHVAFGDVVDEGPLHYVKAMSRIKKHNQYRKLRLMQKFKESKKST